MSHYFISFGNLSLGGKLGYGISVLKTLESSSSQNFISYILLSKDDKEREGINVFAYNLAIRLNKSLVRPTTKV